jgi:predicted DNA-binding ribbon-helix-helix protein
MMIRWECLASTAEATMQSPVVKHSIAIGSHKTSISLEDAFWQGLKDIAESRGVPLRDLVANIDTERQHGNLSSAIRLFVHDHYRNGTASPDRSLVAVGQRHAAH